MSLIHTIDKYGKSKQYQVAHIYREKKITYEELRKKSDALAAFIIENYENDKCPIMVFGHKESEMLVSFMGCVKSGHAYIPVDSSLPNDRIKEIIEVANPKIVIAIEKLNLQLPQVEIITLDVLNDIFKEYDGNVVDDINYVKENEVYYIIFTSGSTGKPKGVQITLQCLESFINWGLSLCGGNKNIFMNQAPFSFDLSVMDTYLSLASGGTLFSIDKKMISNMKELFYYLNISDITTWVSTPSFADMCLSDSTFNSTILPNLKTMLFCGETLTNSTVEKLHNRFSNTAIYNTYGPTETTVAITSIKVDKEINCKEKPLPVGYCKDDTHVFIVDKNLNILQEGNKGEIVIAGDSVSIGYLNDEKNTNKSFYKIKIKDKEIRAYRTGDKGYLKNNLLYYNGRLDFQVKLNGYRIELEDIESNLKKVKNVENAVVIPYTKDEKIQYLIGVVKLKENIEEKEFKIAMMLKNELKNHIPEYMIPRKIVIKNQLPITQNGKVDRKLLMEEMI